MIAEINSTTQVNTLNTEKSKLETYQAKLVSAEITLNSAEKKYKREAALWKEKATSKEDFESAQDALAAAKTNVTELKTIPVDIPDALGILEENGMRTVRTTSWHSYKERNQWTTARSRWARPAWRSRA